MMFKHIVFLVSMVIVVVQSQRPSYAGSANRYPSVLPQYLQPQQSTQNSLTPIDNRINNDDEIISNSVSTTNSWELSNLPIEAHGDIDLINRIKTWPREKQPFWYLNWRQIEAHRGRPTSNSGPTNPRPSFAGSMSSGIPAVHSRFQQQHY